ncbi:glycogenin-1-like isoform X3 [Lytechinus pictus]|uniref:glycogenin-1-like isoform X3 n=1 Tax=Lytechinus pictus TaxID=7653 RepID=UPI0030B9BA98
MSGKVEDQAFVTLVTNDRYAYGALVVGQSLRDVGTTRQLAILITPEVTQPMRRQLSMLYDYIQEVNPLDSQDDAHLALLTRPDLGITFTKLYSWRLTRYSKCVFLDADTLVLQNVDDLFDREELSAAPDVGWPDCFNSGVFVFKPSNETYRGLLQCAVTQGSFDGGDQGLLNTFFSDWATADINKHLPFVYNMTSAISYSYLPAFVRFGNEVRIVHFIGRTKPWMYRYNTHTGTITRPSDVDVTHDSIYVKIWWDVFMSKVKPRVEQEQASNTSQSSVSGTEGRTNQAQGQDEVMTAPPVVDTRPQGQSQTQSVHCNVPDDNTGIDLANVFGDLSLEGDAGHPGGPPSPRADQHAWERGQIDYRGNDSFDNIMGRISEVMSDPAVAAAVVDSNSITPVNMGSAAAENNATKS